jgi:hypothetical protein
MEPFEGFVQPTKNFFHMPNDWIDICADIDNLSELKVIQYVIRHTWGFQEYGIAKAITVDEFMNGRKRADGSRMDKGTGLKSDRSVKDGLKAALEHGYLVCVTDASDLGRIRKSYALKMRGGQDVIPEQVETTREMGRKHPSSRSNLPLSEVDTTPRTEKDTLERHSGKEETQPSLIPLVPVTKGAKLTASPEAQIVIERWRSCFKKPIPDSDELIRAAEKLVPLDLSAQDMLAIRKYAFANDTNGWYKQRGFRLRDVLREYEGWLSTQPQEEVEPPKKPGNIIPGTREEYREWKRRQAI